MTHNEMIEVIAAHRDGKKIEATHKAFSKWDDVMNPPLWNFQHNNYRIKPEPLTLEECVRIALKEADEGIGFEKSMGEKFLKLAKENGHV